MSAEVVVICPEFSPGSGGVGDYTLRVVEQWRDVHARFLVAAGAATDPTLRVEEFDPAKLPPGGKVLLQYSAYGFHHYGYPRKLLRELIRWKREADNVLVTMFHEIWTFWPLLNKNRPIQALHRRDMGSLVRIADAVFTSTPSQAEHLRSASGRETIEVLPVGSNIDWIGGIEGEKERGLAVIFGLQGSRITALRKMQEHLRSLARRGVITRLVTAGGGNTPTADREEQEIARALQLRDGEEFRRALPQQAISLLLASASFAISAQDELSVTKSGTFMAYAAHGLNIISPHASASGPEPLCWAVHPGELLAGVADAELRARAEKLRAWHDRTCSWPHIAAEFARALRLGVPQSMSAPIPAP